MSEEEFQPRVLHIGYMKWGLEDVGRLPEGKLPRKLKKRLKKELDNPDRKLVFSAPYQKISIDQYFKEHGVK